MTGRRLFLKSLIGSTVGYCFLQSVPLVGQGVSVVGPVVTRFLVWIDEPGVGYYLPRYRGVIERLEIPEG